MKYKLKVRDSDNKLLEVWQEMPSKGSKFPTIILVSGFGMDLHEYGFFDEVNDILIKNGFQVFRFNFEGIGASEGKFVNMTIDKQKDQLKDIVNYVKKDRFTDSKRIGIMAHSFGVATTLVSLPLDVQAFLFTGTSIDPLDSLGRYFKRQRGYYPEEISERERIDNKVIRIGPEFWKNLAKVDFKSKTKLIEQPVLFIQGEKDINSKPWQLEEFYNLIKSKKRFLMMEKADHAMSGKFRVKLLELIKDWFNEILHEELLMK